MIKVSVIVPIYNVEKYLRRCIDSLINQTLKEIEIILVNDGSTDKSQDIIDSYSKKYPERIISLIKKNGGLSDARNYGLPYAKGKYIGFVDSDDYVDEKMFQLLFESAEENSADIVTCDYYKVYGDKKILVKSRNFENKNDMLIAPLAAAWNKIYRREMLEKSGIIFPKGLIYEDTEFYAKLAMYCNKISYVEKPLVYYVQRVGSIANSQGEKTTQIFDIFTDIIAFYKQKEFYDQYSQELEYFCIRIGYGSNLVRVSRIKNGKLRKKLAVNTITQLERLFPNYRLNKYLRSNSFKRHLLIRTIRKWNIGAVSSILHVFFLNRDKSLMQ